MESGAGPPWEQFGNSVGLHHLTDHFDLDRKGDFRITMTAMEIHRSAAKHGVSGEDVVHAVTHERVSVDLEPDAIRRRCW